MYNLFEKVFHAQFTYRMDLRTVRVGVQESDCRLRIGEVGIARRTTGTQAFWITSSLESTLAVTELYTIQSCSIFERITAL